MRPEPPPGFPDSAYPMLFRNSTEPTLEQTVERPPGLNVSENEVYVLRAADGPPAIAAEGNRAKMAEWPSKMRTCAGSPEAWPQWHRLVHPHYTPTRASRLGRIEIWFSILASSGLQQSSVTNSHRVYRAIDRFTAAHNENPVALEWTKSVVDPGQLWKH